MKRINRRTFLASGTAVGVLGSLDLATVLRSSETPAAQEGGAGDAAVDFRFAPTEFQSTICFPDDPDKTVIGKWGDLRYDFPANPFAGVGQFGTIVEFTLAGMPRSEWGEQRMEAPGISIVHTLIERPNAFMELIAFPTRRAGEGRVDNVLMEIRPRAGDVIAAPRLRIRSCTTYRLGPNTGLVNNVYRDQDPAPWMVCIPQNACPQNGDLFWRGAEGGYEFFLEHGTAQKGNPLRVLFRLPQKGATGKVDTDVTGEELLGEARAWWRTWQPFDSKVAWSLPSAKGDFLVACARNIQQAREVKNGMLVFEVGPTVYRGMWIVDGNFLLEAARYLGYDHAADQGLLSEWTHQVSTGQIIASAGKEHWKDTAIAMFTLVRACELKQDWTMMRQLAPQLGHAIEFLIDLRNGGRKGDSPNGKYGILPPGFADGGMGGIHDEFTNTLWALAGLRAVARASRSLGLSDLSRAAGFYHELRAAFEVAAHDQMVADPRGFRYLPMLMRQDPAKHLDAWDRPRPQTCQWALSQTIFPGEVFAKDSPIVRGHVALMQACTQEDVPADTGWLHRGGVWNYNAAFVAEVYLWAGLRDWAHRTFTGYLNHASPLHAWREEQPLQNALIGEFWGDMPHNWASAECIRYLRHMLVLEDDRKLRLLEGVRPVDLEQRKGFRVTETPTRFGRVSLDVQPAGMRGWKARFVRHEGKAPETVELRAGLAPGADLSRVEGAAKRKGANSQALLDPASTQWTAYWGL
ncbi:MAG TPA: hypothetical protein VME18_05030 [Acidobacteriaceae bacterium]|nr:hypothetical protein [Acidobacteriaceae bacterium]